MDLFNLSAQTAYSKANIEMVRVLDKRKHLNNKYFLCSILDRLVAVAGWSSAFCTLIGQSLAGTAVRQIQ